MQYLSEIINKKLFKGEKVIGKVIDLVITADQQKPYVTKLLVKYKGDKKVIPSHAVSYTENGWRLTGSEMAFSPYDEKDFYLSEDLLDKQVIDINGRRLVRVNDVHLVSNGQLAVSGIDIGFSGILRRLGVGNIFNLVTITLPWSLIEAFDYQTGTVQLKLTQNRLNTFHPAEIADILEEAGTKERLGIVSVLDSEQAASAIEEANEETQSAILEQVSMPRLKSIITRMPIPEIADIIKKINPFTSRQILHTLGTEKAKKIQKLLIFADDVAGGLMDPTFDAIVNTTPIDSVIALFSTTGEAPEGFVVVDGTGRYIGAAQVRDLFITGKNKTAMDVIRHTISIDEETEFPQILRIFAEYNIRVLPVIDKDKKVVGVITVDTILSRIQEEEERNDAI